MVVIVMDTAHPSLRGELTNWLLEPKPGTFVGNLSTAVRERIWDKIRFSPYKCGGALMIYSTNTEQGFKIEMHGDPKRTIIDLDGVQLIKIT